jgi:hypothetical protein
MKVHYRINTVESGKWPRCSEVTLRDDVLTCALNFDRAYTLAEAYKDDLHIRFANAQTDRDLIAFVRTWGPLIIADPQIPDVVNLRLSQCRALQHWFRALFDLLGAFKRAEEERETLQAFIRAECETLAGLAVDIETNSLLSLRHDFHVNGNISEWIKDVDLRTVRAAIDCLIPQLPIGPGRPHLVCRRERGRRYVEAGWAVFTLEDALRWMVWYDEFTRHPLVCCSECRKVFRAETAHVRKYCSHECAHRATGRNWQRKWRNISRKLSKREQRGRRK